MGKKGKDTHDRKVREIARELKSEGYEVKADLPSYEKPDPIGKDNRIPDVHAKNWWGDEVIVEVDTPNTIDREQLSSFRKSASQKDAEFRHEIVKPRKKKK
jgi:hypothetical protein